MSCMQVMLRKASRNPSGAQTIVFWIDCKATRLAATAVIKSSYVQLNPCRSVVACTLLSPNETINPSIDQVHRRLRAQEEMVEAHGLVVWPAMTEITPERPERCLGMDGP